MNSTSPPLPSLPPRADDSHKGDFGRVLAVGGSRGMAGSIALTGMAALHGGAGLVTVATAESCLPLVAGFEPCLMTVPLLEDEQGRIAATALPPLQELVAGCDVLACGPGLGRGSDLKAVVEWLQRNVTQPVVFDADGLNALSERHAALNEPAGPRVLTPHPGEFQRLAGEDAPAGDRDAQCEQAIRLAAAWRAVVVLKGHRTLITDGARTAVIESGNPGMATAGCGDVLTGLVAALLGQGLEPFAAAHLAAHLHGLAGDRAARQYGQPGLLARHLLDRFWG